MSEYNLLTKKLLQAGFDVEHYPEYAKIPTGGRMSNDNPLDNLYGGFEYTSAFTDNRVYETPCGYLVKGENAISDLYCGGLAWTHENDCPVIVCPFGDVEHCKKCHPTFRQTGKVRVIQFCNTHPAEQAYVYEKSIEKVRTDLMNEKEDRFHDFEKARHGRVCRNHCSYDPKTKCWSMHYDPIECGRHYNCQGFCPVLGKDLSKKKGNVYYDLHLSGITPGIGLWPDTKWIRTHAASQFYDHPVSMTICEATVKLERGEILNKWKLDHHAELYYDRSMEVSVRNIRAEVRPTRDLFADLETIQAGGTVSWGPEVKKEAAEAAKRKREERRQKRIKNLEKKLITYGLEHFEEHSAVRRNAQKLLSSERLEELEMLYKKNCNRAVQRSLWE